MSFVSLLNTAWMIGCRREAMAFRTSVRHVAQTQARLLAEIVRQNQETEFGRSHRFADTDSAAAYQQRVPLSSYEDYAQAIARIGDGHPAVLTRQPVELLEPTSGTTGGEKLIPFTAALRQQFQRAVAAWMYDLLHHRPALRKGRAYWSISPAMGAGRRTACGIAIGFDNDADYLGAAGQWLMKRLLVAPSHIARLSDTDAFRYRTLWHLLAARDLSLISVWSPTFLTTLLAPLEAWQDKLLFDLENGLPTGSEQRGAHMRHPERAAVLRSIFVSHLSWPEKLRRIWPQLSLISTWADAGATMYIGQLLALFPNAEIQPKGLLATEGCVSFPLLGRAASVLAVRSHFFEFQEIGAGGRIRLAHQVDAGGRYRVILTTGGGLYRYQLRDEVEICGFEQQCPLLRFVGKSDCVSDQVGEKLAEPHVRDVLQRLFNVCQLAPRFSLVVPVAEQPPRYRLYLQLSAASACIPQVSALAAALEAGLCENPHYAYARRLGQLTVVEVAVFEAGAASGWTIYENHCLARGMRAGNIKPLMLDRWTGWPALLDPLCRTAPARPSASEPARVGVRIP